MSEAQQTAWDLIEAAGVIKALADFDLAEYKDEMTPRVYTQVQTRLNRLAHDLRLRAAAIERGEKE